MKYRIEETDRYFFPEYRTSPFWPVWEFIKDKDGEIFLCKTLADATSAIEKFDAQRQPNVLSSTIRVHHP